MSKQKDFYLVLDVETANTTLDPLVYDLGYMVVDRKGHIYEKESFLIYEIFVQERSLMQSSYYSEKLPTYEERIKSKESRIVRYSTARKIIRMAIEHYSITKVGAYNASFDRRALNTTLRYLTNSRQRYFLPYGLEWFCIWHMACQVLLTQRKFFKMAEEEDWFSPCGNLQTNAEVCYRYLIGGHEFQEEHKGLDDVAIETFILTQCIRRHKKMDWGINRRCWTIPTAKYKEVRGIK